MPDTKSNDMGNIAGKIHSHSVPGRQHCAARGQRGPTPDGGHRKLPEERRLSIDIFALSNAAPAISAAGGPQAELQTTFAVGEEAEMETTGESAAWWRR